MSRNYRYIKKTYKDEKEIRAFLASRNYLPETIESMIDLISKGHVCKMSLREGIERGWETSKQPMPPGRLEVTTALKKTDS